MDPVLVATLGAEPQIIPLAAGQLLRHAPLAGIVVLHTRADLPPARKALPALRAAFATLPGWPPLRTVEAPVDDVLTPAEFDVFAAALYATLKAEIAVRRPVHLLLAGGRKPMALLAMSVAQLLFGPEDRVWYLHSDDELRRSGRFVPIVGDQVQLIAIPLTPMQAAPPRLTRLFAAETPAAARQTLADTQLASLRHFIDHELTPAERAVAALVAADVLTVKAMAAQLQRTPKTVTNQLTNIYSKLESVFGLQPEVGVKREFLRRELGPLFEDLGGNSHDK